MIFLESAYRHQWQDNKALEVIAAKHGCFLRRTKARQAVVRTWFEGPSLPSLTLESAREQAILEEIAKHGIKYPLYGFGS